MSRPFQPHIITDDSASGGLRVEGSFKFDNQRKNYLLRTPASDGNKQRWTCSVWVKRKKIGSQQKILAAGSSSSSFISFEFQGDDKLQLFGYGDGATQLHLRTSSLYRDTSAWYHIVVYIDTITSSAKLYVNGAEPPLDTNTQPTANYSFHITNNVAHNIGRDGTVDNYYFDGYLTQFYHIDGQALDPSHFGYTDAATGIWRPKKYDQSGPNNGTQWRNGISGNIYSGTTAMIFDGKLDAIGIDGNGNASNNHLTFSSVNVRASSVGVRVSNSGSDIQVSINGSVVGTVASGSMSNNVAKLFTFTFDETLVSTIKVQRVGSSSGWFLYEFQLDEIPLVDNNTSNIGLNGFYLPFDGVTEIPLNDASGNNNDFIGYNSAKPSVSLPKATGALPIMRTNKGGSIALTGVRSDPFGSNCKVAVPGHNTFQDYARQISGSGGSGSTVNTSGSPVIDASGSGQIGNQCIYRNSIKLDRASSQYIEIPFSSFNLGTGDFTVECWAQLTSHVTDVNLFNLYEGSTRKFFVQARVNNSANDFHCRFYGSGNQYNSNEMFWQNSDFHLKIWFHVAVVRSSGTFKVYVNGLQHSPDHNTSSENLGNVDRLRVGYMAGDGTKYVTGHVQDIRFYNAAKYTSNFSVCRGNSNLVDDSPSGVAVPREPDYDKFDNGSVTIDGNNDWLNIAPSSDFDLGSNWTIEFFFYPFNTDNAKVISTRGDSSPRGWEIVYWDGGLVGIEQYGDQSTSGQQKGTKKVHPHAWHHIAITHNGTNTKTYINGFLDLNYTGSSGSNWGSGGHNLRIGRPENFAENGYYAISNVRIVKGTVVYTNDFTPPSSPLTNITNTKLLCCNSKLSATAATVTPNTITKNSYILANNFNPFDVVDTIGQESGYCTLNPIDQMNNVTLGDGGLSFACTSGNDGKVRGTHSFTKGKFYFEWTVNIASRVHVGVMDTRAPLITNQGDFGLRNDEWGLRTDGYKVHNSTEAQITTDSTNLQGYIWMVAVDADNGKIYFGKNGRWLTGANPRTGANAHYTNLGGHRLAPAVGRRSGANAGLINFGATPFVYTPPEGFKAICTSNIEDEPIVDPKQHFETLTWTGNGGTQSISGLKFKPDFVWIKDRDQNGYSHAIFDTIRGATKRLFSDANNGESTQNTTLTAFDNFGFTLGSSGAVNQSSHDYVAWCWKAGGHDGSGYWRDGVEYASKTDLVSGGIVNEIGAISINTKAGFSIISFGGTGSSADLPHGLGKAPKFVLIKKYSAGGNSWAVYCDGPGAGPNKQILLNSSNAASTDNNGFNAEPDETFVHLGSGSSMATNQNGQNIAYVWAEIPGYSRFGTYRGDNETDGTFIHCGFRPRFFLWKVLGRSGGWGLIDTARDTYNVSGKQIGPDDDDAEASFTVLDITSNGIKMRNTYGDTNQVYDHLFMAFAEQPVSNPYGGQSNAR
tara:strand:- start:469 stop:4758 length:4290 start_codon:yes stop_codon:yes gene_type:complete